jgi:hypothetical protein
VEVVHATADTYEHLAQEDFVPRLREVLRGCIAEYEAMVRGNGLVEEPRFVPKHLLEDSNVMQDVKLRPRLERSRGELKVAVGAVEKEQVGEPATLSTPVNHGGPVSYQKGEQVEYRMFGKWIPTTVSGVREDGRLELSVNPNVWLSVEVQDVKLRPRHCGGGSGPRPVGAPATLLTPVDSGGAKSCQKDRRPQHQPTTRT